MANWPAGHAPGLNPGGNFRPTIDLRYMESAAIQVRGSITGRLYRFSAAQPLQAVDARDAAALLGTRLFRRA